MAKPNRSHQEIQEHRARIATLYLKGWSQRQMAQELDVSRDTIRFDLEAIREAWKKSALFDFNEAIGQQLARLNLMESEAWEAYEKSKANRTVTVTRQRRRTLPAASDAVLDNVAEAVKRDEQRDADPRYLQIALDCIRERNKLLGLYPPEELRHSGTVDLQISEVFYESIPVPAGQDAHLTIIGGQQPPPPNGQVIDVPELAAPAENEPEA